MKLTIDVGSSLAWRLARHGLEPRVPATVPRAVEYVVALRAWPAAYAEAAVGARRPENSGGSVEDALSTGALIMSYAFRGGSYFFAPETGSFVLSARALSRSWESPRFQRQAGFVLDDWESFREAIREILADSPRTRQEISSALGKSAHLGSLAPAALGTGSDALYKPLHWWGDISFGPYRDGQATFQLRSGGLHLPEPLDIDALDADVIGARVVRDYVRSYAPVTRANLRYWLTEGLSVPSRTVSRWLSTNVHELIEVETSGCEAYVVDEDLDDIREAQASDVVRLIPGFDPWIMGPGTADSRIIHPRHRAEATKGSNLVLVGGRVVGTWRHVRDEVRIKHFEEADIIEGSSLHDEVRRMIGSDQEVSIVQG